MSDLVTPEDLLAALGGEELIIVTLPPRARCPAALIDAIEAFEPDERPAAIASGTWLGEKGLDEHGYARTYVWIAEGRVHAFFSMSVGVCELTPDELVELQAGPRQMPAVLLAQAARARQSDVAPNAILMTALGIAEEITALAGASVLILDPFDEPTEQMWRARGFRPTSDTPRRNRPRRLWTELGAS